MWFFPTKKEVKKEFDKIKEGFKDRDKKQVSYFETIKRDYETILKTISELRDKQEINALKIATLEGAYLVMSQKSQVSISRSPKQSHVTFETKLIKRIKNNKKSLVMAEIVKLMGSMSVIEMFENIVKERGLCSKASFYRYIESLKSQSLIKSETELRQK